MGLLPGARAPEGRSAGRSATPIFQPERDPERNSENSAGARLERNSDFTRSANTLPSIYFTLKIGPKKL